MPFKVATLGIGGTASHSGCLADLFLHHLLQPPLRHTTNRTRVGISPAASLRHRCGILTWNAGSLTAAGRAATTALAGGSGNEMERHPGMDCGQLVLHSHGGRANMFMWHSHLYTEEVLSERIIWMDCTLARAPVAPSILHGPKAT